MKIRCVEIRRIEMPLAVPYRIARETVERAVNLLLRVETDSALAGWGVAAPDPGSTGESVEAAEAALGAIVEPALHGADPLRRERIMEEIRKEPSAGPSARAAADIALHDLAGRTAGIPLWKLLGGYRRSFATSVTLGILPAREAAARAADLVEQGFRALKLKGGIDVEEDIERFRRVRESVGERIELRFDANQGFDPRAALRFVEAVEPLGLELLEQPTPVGLPEQLRSVTEGSRLPVMADESLASLRDAFRLARGGLVDMVNLKIQKVGGISEAAAIDSVARAARLESMVGCMDEAALGIAAGLHFALGRPNVAYCDLDGHLDLRDDPTAGAVRLHRGRLSPCEGPGLGFTPER